MRITLPAVLAHRVICAPCNLHFRFPAVLSFSHLPIFQGAPDPWIFALLLATAVPRDGMRLLLMVTTCTVTRAFMSPWGTADILRIYTHDCLNTCVFPAATPSLGFHLLTFSLSLIKLLIDTPPARLLRSCQMSSDIEEYYANISGTHGVSMIWCQTGKHWSSSLTTSPSALPNREL